MNIVKHNKVEISEIFQKFFVTLFLITLPYLEII